MQAALYHAPFVYLLLPKMLIYFSTKIQHGHPADLAVFLFSFILSNWQVLKNFVFTVYTLVHPLHRTVQYFPVFTDIRRNFVERGWL